jgi:Skp family chaperone for outer membrane proteins
MPRSNDRFKARVDQIGWVCAAAVAGVILASGFDAQADKTGVVDLASVVNRSNVGVSDGKKFDEIKKARQDLLEFVEANPVLTTEQAQQLHDLVIKESLTDADKALMTKVKNDVQGSVAQSQVLAGKANLTAEERTQLEEFRHRADVMGMTEQRWFQEFTKDLQDWSEKHHRDNLEKAREAVNQVAKAQGYTLVFDKAVAPYGANDLTEPALQAMNAQK